MTTYLFLLSAPFNHGNDADPHATQCFQMMAASPPHSQILKPHQEMTRTSSLVNPHRKKSRLPTLALFRKRTLHPCFKVLFSRGNAIDPHVTHCFQMMAASPPHSQMLRPHLKLTRTSALVGNGHPFEKKSRLPTPALFSILLKLQHRLLRGWIVVLQSKHPQPVMAAMFALSGRAHSSHTSSMESFANTQWVQVPLPQLLCYQLIACLPRGIRSARKIWTSAAPVYVHMVSRCFH
jgi:hypothetical protein